MSEQERYFNLRQDFLPRCKQSVEPIQLGQFADSGVGGHCDRILDGVGSLSIGVIMTETRAKASCQHFHGQLMLCGQI